MNMEKPVAIYALRVQGMDLVFYVGQTVRRLETRLEQHRHADTATNPRETNAAKDAWFALVTQLGGTVESVPLLGSVSRGHAAYVEQALIAAHRAHGHPLLNKDERTIVAPHARFWDLPVIAQPYSDAVHITMATVPDLLHRATTPALAAFADGQVDTEHPLAEVTGEIGHIRAALDGCLAAIATAAAQAAATIDARDLAALGERARCAECQALDAACAAIPTVGVAG